MADSSHFGENRIKVTRIKMPETEEIVPEAPTDAIGRYLLILPQWEALTRRQATYEQQLKDLQVQGDQLRAEWEALAVALGETQAELQTLDLPLDEVITRVWDLIKGHLWAKGLSVERRSTLQVTIPKPLREWIEPGPRNPRLK